MRIKSHKDLEVWQRAMDLVVSCYQVSRGFPEHELYGLSTQLRRAAVSVPANIAEGRARRTTQEFLRFLAIARGSLAELQTHIEIADRLGYVPPETGDKLLQEAARVGKMLNALKRSLEKTP